MGNADQQGSMPISVPAQVGERSIVVASAHSHPIAVRVEADEWDEQQV
jgi:hypothetical protein